MYIFTVDIYEYDNPFDTPVTSKVMAALHW